MKILSSVANIFKKIQLAQRSFWVQRHAAAYDGSSHSKRLAHWNASSESINSILASNLSTLRNRSHDIIRKNPYAANAVEAIVSNCIGTGIKPQSKAKSAEFTRVPQNTIEVTDEKTAQNIMRLLNRLEEHDDVQNVYANFDIDDELMEKIDI